MVSIVLQVNSLNLISQIENKMFQLMVMILLSQFKPSLFFFVVVIYLESGFFFSSIAYLMVANLAQIGISVHC